MALNMLKEIEQSGKACSDSLDQVEALYDLWQPLRKETIALLNSVADELDEDNQISDEVTIGTKATGVASGALVVGGLIAAPFTFGGSLALTTVGGVFGTACGAANFGKNAAFDEEKSRLLETTTRKFMEDKFTTERLQACIKDLNTNVKDVKKLSYKIGVRQDVWKKAQSAIDESRECEEKKLQKELEELNEGLIEAVSAIEEYIKQVIKKGEVEITPQFAGKLRRALEAILKLPKTYMLLRRVSRSHAEALSSMASSSLLLGGVVAGSLRTSAKAGSGVGKALSGVGYVFCGIAIAIDMFELVCASVHRSKGSKTREAQDLRSICKHLQEEKEDFDKIRSKLQEELA